MAFGDPSREDAAADAVPTGVAVRLLRGAALVDDHRVTRDAARGVVRADGERPEKDFRRARLRLNAHINGREISRDGRQAAWRRM